MVWWQHAMMVLVCWNVKQSNISTLPSPALSVLPSRPIRVNYNSWTTGTTHTSPLTCQTQSSLQSYWVSLSTNLSNNDNHPLLETCNKPVIFRYKNKQKPREEIKIKLSILGVKMVIHDVKECKPIKNNQKLINSPNCLLLNGGKPAEFYIGFLDPWPEVGSGSLGRINILSRASVL